MKDALKEIGLGSDPSQGALGYSDPSVFGADE